MNFSKKLTVVREFTNNHTHLHTDASLADGGQTVVEALDTLKANGATAAAITDHGICANWIEFYLYARKIGIKPILGVEAYIETEIPFGEDDDTVANEHLVLLAKNYKGFMQISRFVSSTNRNLKSIAGVSKPIGTMDLLRQCFGPDAIDSGNVICTSACIAGPLAQAFSYNYRIDKEIKKITDRNEKIKDSFTEEYYEAKEYVDAVSARLSIIAKEIDQLQPISKKKYAATKKKLQKMKDSEEKEFLLNQLAVEEAETEKAIQRIADLKEQKKELNAKVKDEKAFVNKFKEKLKKISANEEKIKNFESVKKTEDDMKSDAIRIAEEYRSIFGKDFYAEVQYHGIGKEAFIYPRIANVAKELNIPIVAANDAHYARKEDMLKRQLLINAGRISRKDPKWFAPMEGDDELYIKTGQEMASALTQILPEDVVIEAMDNIDTICDQCDLFIDPEIKHYPKFENAKELLRARCEKGAKFHFPDGLPDNYRRQLEYELGIIDKMGYNDYFCEVIDFIDYAKNSADCSIETGPGRGSGAGSLACYFSGITTLDPMDYDLMFERFLNPERVSMPDIDTDFSGHARKICIKHVKEKYGERSVASIMTKGTMAARKSLDYSGKLYGLKNFNEKGRFGKLVKEIKAILGDDPKASLKNKKIQEQLEASYADNEAASTIIKWATLMEGYITSYGTHAAGVIIGDGTDIENYIPLMASTDEDGNPVFAVQADMVQCEALLGFIKMDFLGLKNLNIITDAMRMIRDNYGVTFDPYNLPFEEAIFREIFAKGDTNFVFQFESDGMKKMLKDFHPTDFKDIILLVACYRPGPMDFIPDIIHAKETGEPSEFIKRFPMLKPVLEETYGYPVYQEQVMKIMTICASFTTGMADNVRRHMSKKHEEELAKIRPDFVAGCVKNGISAEDANWLFDQLMPFAKYGFNKSHAASYATVSYITAWAKYHYFKEYICAAITTQDKKTSALKVDCEGRSVTIYRPDINESGVHFQPFKDGIICGLSSIKGTKAAAEIIVKEREENGIFTSAENFVERVKIKADNLKALVLSGAFDSFTNNREAFLDYLTEYAGIQKDIIAVEGKLADIEEKPEETEKEQEAKAKSRKETETKLALMLDNLNSVKVGTKIALSTQKRLAYESEYLDMWVTGNPMEDYDVSDKKYIMISDIEHEGKVTIPGIVTEFKLLHRKSDGANMCQFKLVDKTGNGIRCCCFVANYAKLENILKDGQVIAVTAKAELSETDTQDTNPEDPDANVEQEDVYELIVQDAVKLNPADKILTIISKDIVQKVEDIVPLIKLMASDEGYVCKVYDKTFREIQSVTTRVDAEIIERLEGLGIEYTCA